HICTYVMPPHLHPSLRIKVGILEECVVYAPELTKPVGIVKPSYRRHQVEPLTEAARIFRSVFHHLYQSYQISCQCVHALSPCFLIFSILFPTACFNQQCYFFTVITAVSVPTSLGS